MEQFINVLIIIHIVAGTLALICGPAAMIVEKGSDKHRLFGKIFFYSMMIVAASAIIVASSPKHRSVFLIVIGVFSAYMPLSAYRILHLKFLNKNQRPKIADWDISLYMACFTALMLYYSVHQFIKGYTTEAIVLLVFSVLAINMLRSDYTIFTRKMKDPNFWLYVHISRMIGANIAAYTAFLVVNNHNVLPPLVAWLLPTPIGIALIIYFIRSYKEKLKGGKEVYEIADVRIFPKVEEPPIPPSEAGHTM